MKLSGKQLLIKIITLVMLEKRTGQDAVLSTDLCKTVIESLPKADTEVDVDWGKLVYDDLKTIATELAEDRFEVANNESEFFQQIKITCRDDTYLYDALYQTLTDPRLEDEERLKETVRGLRTTLKRHLKDQELFETYREYSKNLTFNFHKMENPQTYIREMCEVLSSKITSDNTYRHDGDMGEVDFNDIESLKENFRRAERLLSNEGALQVGWHGIQRMLGKALGFRRGESILLGALSHNFKSGMMLSLLAHVIKFNKPSLKDPNCKPLILFLSFENDVSYNLRWLYQYFYENEHKQPAEMDNIDAEEAAPYVMGKCLENGWHVRMPRIDPTNFTVSDLRERIESYRRDNYEVVAAFVDYLNLMSKGGIETTGVAGDDIRMLARTVRNFCSARGITFITPHQLSSEAQSLQALNPLEFTKTVANQGKWDGCRRLHHEFDLELCMNIVTVDKKDYLDIQRGKHRDIVTPREYHHCTLPFMDYGTIPWDFDRPVSEAIDVSLNDSGFDEDFGSMT